MEAWVRPLMRTFPKVRRHWRRHVLELVRGPATDDAARVHAAAVARDYTFLRRAMAERTRLGSLYEMNRVDQRTELDKARDVAARVGLKLPARAPP